MSASFRPSSRTLLQLLAFTWMLPVVASSQAATITVNSAADTVANDGHCTLREAINSANNNIASGGMSGECAAGQALPTVDVIAFNIPDAGVHTISPSTQLIITQAVKIDGYTQPGSSVNTLAVGDNAVLLIEIAGGAVDGAIQLNGPFSVDSSGSTIRGLVIDQNSGRGIFVGNGFGNGSNNDTIVGNFLGVDPTGMTVTSTNTPINAVSSTNLVVGGSSPADRNVISALNQDPIFFNQTSSSFVQGNYIGVNAAGTASLGAFEGILLIQGSTNDKIGGSGAGEGNVIYGSFKAIRIDTSDTTTIQGNFIGTDASGSIGLGGSSFGIGIESSSGTIVGGSGPGAGNVISGNIVGIQVGNSTSGTIIQGNKIGTDIGGTQPVPNTSSGIRLTGNAPGGGSIIGGSNPGEGNTIANSCGIGVEFNQQVANWPILGNSMYANGYGIALQPSNEPVINDTGDADTGANNLQNHPIITSAPISAGNVTITGTLNSVASTQYRLEFFSSIDCNRSGFGEGRTFLGFANATTDASGNASFNFLTFAVPAGQTAIAATATDPNGNTSEFSLCVGGIGRIFADGFEPSCPGG